MKRNPRRSYDAEGREIPPMPLSNMRWHGVRSVNAECLRCRHEATVNVDALPMTFRCPTWRCGCDARRAARNES
jgi:hypothetical protein